MTRRRADARSTSPWRSSRRNESENGVLRFLRREQADDGECRGGAEVVAHVLESVVLREVRGRVRRERGAEDSRQVERERAPRIPDRRWKELGQHRPQRTVDE